jgi:hypothetical protein
VALAYWCSALFFYQSDESVHEWEEMLFPWCDTYKGWSVSRRLFPSLEAEKMQNANLFDFLQARNQRDWHF